MCFRLLAAVQHEGGLAALEALATAQGLDVRAAPAGPAAGLGYLEIAWGDCACSLYSRRDGRARVVAYVEALCDAGRPLQLLLFRDGDALELTGAPAIVDLETFRREGLQALPEGCVAALSPHRRSSSGAAPSH